MEFRLQDTPSTAMPVTIKAEMTVAMTAVMTGATTATMTAEMTGAMTAGPVSNRNDTLPGGNTPWADPVSHDVSTIP